MSLGKSLFQQLVALSVFSRHYYFVQSPHFITQSNCELVCALKTWTYWLSRYHAEVILAECTLAEQHNFFELLSQLTDNVFYALGTWTFSQLISNFFSLDCSSRFNFVRKFINMCVFLFPEHRTSIDNKILSISAHFFATLVNSVRTQYLFQHHSVQALIENITTPALRSSLDTDVSCRKENHYVFTLLNISIL